MNSDHDINTGRLYREIIREANRLGDEFLVDMVLMRLAGLTQGSMVPQPKTKIILFPHERLQAFPATGHSQPLWMTIMYTAMIPFGMFLLLAAFHYLSASIPFPCQP